MDDNLDGKKKSVDNFVLIFLVIQPICQLLYIQIMYNFRCQSLHKQTKIVYANTPRDLYPSFTITHTAAYVGKLTQPAGQFRAFGKCGITILISIRKC